MDTQGEVEGSMDGDARYRPGERGQEMVAGAVIPPPADAPPPPPPPSSGLRYRPPFANYRPPWESPPPTFTMEPVPGEPGVVRPVLDKQVWIDEQTGGVRWEGDGNDPLIEPEPGPVERSVRTDLERLGRLDEGVRGSLAQMALRMAQAYDQYDGADLAKLARANMELRQTLSLIAEVGDDGDGDEAARESTPEWSGGAAAVRDGEVAGAADVGAEDGGGGSPAG